MQVISQDHQENALKVRNAALSSLPYFTSRLGWDIHDCHLWWADWRVESERRSLILAPRTHGKSTLLTTAYCLWKLAQDPENRLLIVSNTAAQAQSFLREIKGYLEKDNSEVVYLFPHLKPAAKPWTDMEINVVGKTQVTKEANITAIGIGGPVISRHYTQALLDDIIDEDNARTALQRAKVRTWFYTSLMPTLESSGEIHIVGTRYHPRDLYGELIGTEESPGEYWNDTLIASAIQGDGSALCPEFFPATKADSIAQWELKGDHGELAPGEKRRQSLEEIKNGAGTVIFNSQYQNDTELMLGRMFDALWIANRMTLKTVSKLPLILFQGVDLSVGEDSASDYMAIVTVGKDVQTGKIYPLAAFRIRCSLNKQMSAVKTQYGQWDEWKGHKIHKVGIESNAYQGAFSGQMKLDTAIPIQKVFTSKDKQTRGTYLAALFETDVIQMVDGPGVDILREELLYFPDGEHDDLFDALDIAVLMAHGSKGRGVGSPRGDRTPARK